MVEGTGNSSLLRWYFDQTSQKCLTFYYRGKEGNQVGLLVSKSATAYSAPENKAANQFYKILELGKIFITLNTISTLYEA